MDTPDEPPRSRLIPGRLAWGLLIIGSVCLLVLWLAVTAVRPGPGSDGSGSLSESAAQDALEGRGVAVPAAFSFAMMVALPMRGSGTPTLVGRYSATDPLALLGRQLEQENPTFPYLRAATCEDEVVLRGDWAPTGFSCLPDAQLLVATRNADGEPAPEDGLPPGSQTLMLTEGADGVQLYIQSQGY